MKTGKKIANAFKRRFLKNKDDPKKILKDASKAGDAIYEKDVRTLRSPYSRLLDAKCNSLNNNEFATYVNLLTQGLDKYKGQKTTKETERLKETKRALLNAAISYKHFVPQTTIDLTFEILNNTAPKEKLRKKALESLGACASKFSWLIQSESEHKTLETTRWDLDAIMKRVGPDYAVAASGFRTAAKNAVLAILNPASDRYSAPPQPSTTRTRQDVAVNIDGVTVFVGDALNSLRPGQHINDDVIRLDYARMETAHNELPSHTGKQSVTFTPISDVMRMAQQPAKKFMELAEDDLLNLPQERLNDYRATRNISQTENAFREQIRKQDVVFLPLNDHTLSEEQLNNPEAQYTEGGSHWMALAYVPSTGKFHFHNSFDDPDYDELAKKKAANIYSYLVPLGSPAIDIENSFIKHKTPQQGHGSDCGLYMLGNFGAVLERGEFENITEEQSARHRPTRRGLREKIQTAYREHVRDPWKLPSEATALKTAIAANVDASIDLKAPADGFTGTVVHSTNDFLYVRPNHFERIETDGAVKFHYSNGVAAKMLARNANIDPLNTLPIYGIPREDHARDEESHGLSEVSVGDVIEARMVGGEGRPGSVNVVNVTRSVERTQGTEPGPSVSESRPTTPDPLFEKQKVANTFAAMKEGDFEVKTLEKQLKATNEGQAFTSLPLRDADGNTDVGGKAYLLIVKANGQERLINGKPLVVSMDHARLPEVTDGQLITVTRSHGGPDIRVVPPHERRNSTGSATQEKGALSGGKSKGNGTSHH